MVTVKAASTLSAPRTVTSNSGMISESLYPANSWVPVTTLLAPLVALGGQDVLLGDTGNDVLRGGAGRDLANGGVGDDVVFGGDGDDAVWGGIGHDRLFGGYGADDLDLKARAGDPTIYVTVAGLEDRDNRISTTNGADLVYGGWGPDELQADQGGAGPQPGSDQLIDWVGNHNVYYVCNGAYGAGRTHPREQPGPHDAAGRRGDGGRGHGPDHQRLRRLARPRPGEQLRQGLQHQAVTGAPGNFTCEGAG